MAQSAFLALAGLAIGASVAGGMALLLSPLELPPRLSERGAQSGSQLSAAVVPVPARKPERQAMPAQPEIRRYAALVRAEDTLVDLPPPIVALPVVTPRPEAERPRSSPLPIAGETAEGEIHERLEHANIAAHREVAPDAASRRAVSIPVLTGDLPASDSRPPWRRYAALAPDTGDRPQIVIVLDDMGLSTFRSDRAVALPRPLTIAILPYAPDPESLVARARAAGHEVLIHLPMEPETRDADPGPDALLTGLSPAELDRRILANLDRMSGYVGINNHMGSRFTASARGMDRLMGVLKDRGLLFLDSMTTSQSLGRRLGIKHGVPTAARDIFIDNDRAPDSIALQLSRIESVAGERGYAIAIGHPYPETLDALEAWLPTLRRKGFELTPLSAIVARRLTG